MTSRTADRTSPHGDAPPGNGDGTTQPASEVELAREVLVRVAHDIRSPLGSILVLVDALRHTTEGVLTDTQARQLRIVHAATLGLSRIAADLIDGVRDPRLVEGKPRPFSVTQLLADVAVVVKPMVEEAGSELEFITPETDGRLGYAAAIHRALLNLTVNALQHAEGARVCVTCREVDERRLRFTVADEGPGLPAAVRDQLANGLPFVGTGKRFTVSGLGLSIARMLLQSMGSDLEVESAPGEGARFSFVLDLPAAY